MTVEPIVPDAAPPLPAASADERQFASALDAAGAALHRAQDAEDAFAAGRGTLHAAVYERARADVVLAVAAAAAGRAASAVTTILNMQV